VYHNIASIIKDLSDQSRSSGFTIGPGHDNAAVAERACDIAQGVRRQARNQVPGDDGPAATPEASTQHGRGPPRQQCRAVSRTHVVRWNYMREVAHFLRLGV
jgi:hypothetical protein